MLLFCGKEKFSMLLTFAVRGCIILCERFNFDGEERLRATPCVLRTHCGRGEVILYTFSPQFRVQQESTFKLLFNALYK